MDRRKTAKGFHLMGRRTITEKEIALIKTMLNREMKNKDIQFFFNRPDRPVNSGRISTIGTGSYSNSNNIPAASDCELDAFLGTFAPSPHGIKIAPIEKISEPTVAERVRSFFKQEKDKSWILSGGEHQECECKLEFDPKKLTATVRAAAALANNRGGYIFFGIANGSFRAEGIDSTFARTDIVQIIEKIKAHLSPTPVVVAKDTIQLGSILIGFIYIAKHPNPPIIVYRDGDNLNEGEILFRYPGQSARIKFGDLRAMLDERDRRAQVALAGAVGRIADVGTGNALILDTEKNILDAKGHTILIDQQLAENLRFIKEGEFDEKHGSPTLKLVGEVSPVTVRGGTSGVVAHAAIFQEDILQKFLNQEKVDQPIQYIYAGLAQSRLWLPVFYYARMSGETNATIAEFVQSLKVSQKGKKRLLVDRLEGRRSAFTRAASYAAKAIARDISKGSIKTPSSIAEVTPFAYGMTTVKETKATLEQLLTAIRCCKDLADAAEDGNAMGATFKAACWVDELFFAN